jgi:hypothetical protein
MKKYKYKKIELVNEDQLNELGSLGWKVISTILDLYVLMEFEYEDAEGVEDLMPVARTISDPLALYKCQEKVKRYEWGNTMEPTEFLTLEDFRDDNFYSDDDEFEAFLSDGYHFIGTDISTMSDEELDKFIEENKDKFKDLSVLKVYYIDYPEDK